MKRLITFAVALLFVACVSYGQESYERSVYVVSGVTFVNKFGNAPDFDHPFETPEVFTAGTDIEVRATMTATAATAAAVSAGFKITLIDD